MSGFEAALGRYGYLAILVGTFLEGESILVAGALAAHAGYLNIGYVLAAALTGSYFGDQVFFRLGRWLGRPWLAKRPTWQRRAERVYRLMERHDAVFILGFRFLYGLRSVAPFVVGTSTIAVRRFVVLNFLGALLWTGTVGGAGYFLGSLWNSWPQLHYPWTYVAAAAVGAAAAALGAALARRRRRRRATAVSRASAAPAAAAVPHQRPCD